MGLDSDGEPFGNYSQIKFFATEAMAKPILNVFSEEVSLNPELSWSKIEMAVSYQISVSGDAGMDNLLWQENTIKQF